MENKVVIRSAATVGAFILLSRFFGMVRDVLMASRFGTSLGMSAFIVAFTVPNLFRSLLGEGALSTAFVPVFTETMEKQGRDRVWSFASRMLSLLVVLLAALVLAGVLAVTLAGRFPLPDRLAEILRLLRIMLPYLFFICASAFLSAMLNALRRFALPAATPVLLNLVMIAGLAWLCPLLARDSRDQLTVLSWLVVLAGGLQLAVQAPSLWREGFRFRPSLDWRDPGVRQVGRLMAASAIGVGVTQINVLVDRFMAVAVGPGAPSYLYFAERLIYLPLGIFATALGTVLLPTLSRLAARAEFDGIRQTVNDALRHLAFIMLPCAVGILVLAAPIVRVIYERGDFSELSAAGTRLALQCYAPGLVLFSLLKVFIPAFYALQDMRTPVRVGIHCTVLNIGLNALLIWPFGHAGIALGTVLASLVESVWLARLLQTRIGDPGWMAVSRSWVRAGAASALMAGAALAVHPAASRLAHASFGTGFSANLLALAAVLVVAVAVYLLAAWLFRCPEGREILGALRGRRRPAEPAS